MDAVVILAGGKSRRMGRDKLTLEVGGRTLLESVVGKFAEAFDAVYISVAEKGKYREVAVPEIVDIYSGAGPLAGLHAALSSIPCEGVFLVAADLPHATPDAAKRVVELCGSNDACVIKLHDGKLEPLFAYYKSKLLPDCEELLASGEFRMTELIYRANTKFIEPGQLGELWSQRLIYNINLPEDYAKL
ncbi:MAG: molybdenum cofactor guanylyltransferase [Oscillospiraceae bacterium]|nr:molybdenum cofactor guanylyltransferase [Oscillospiraceae bacterium]